MSTIKPFEGLLGNSSELRAIQFLLPLRDMDFNITELTEVVGVSRPTISKTVKKFVEYDILSISSERSGIRYYQINEKSPFVKLFENLNNLLIEHMLGDETLYQIHEYWEDHAPRKETYQSLNDIKSSTFLPFNDDPVWPETEHKAWILEPPHPTFPTVGEDAPILAGGQNAA